MTISPNNPRWNNWQWQHANSCQDLDTLSKWIQATGNDLDFSVDHFTNLTSKYQMGITPYYFGLIRQFNPNDPVFKQVIPAVDELNAAPGEVEDPIGDETPGGGSRPLKALIHRYPNRVLLLPTAQCAVYCRFCFRKRLVGNTAHNAREADLQAAYEYIEQHPEIREVILTGGDPLTLGDQKLDTILNRLTEIKQLRLIRIHTRLPVVNPFRLTPELGKLIARLEKPVWISAHFNHSNEITPETARRIKEWVGMGIPFLNQSVLLKGINDSASSLKALFMGLIEIKVKPYYLHQADLVPGTGHLRVPIERGLRILAELQGELPGYAIPHYVLDSPAGTGKVPLQNPVELNQGIQT